MPASRAGEASRSPQGGPFDANAKKAERSVHPALDALRELDPDTMSPKEALELLYRLKKLSD